MSYSTNNIKNATQFNPVTGGKHHRANELLNNRIIKIENKHNDSITALRGSINVLSATKVNYSTLSDTALQLRSDLATKVALIDTAAKKWGTSGNTLSSAGVIGSLNAQDIKFVTNNIARATISSTGNFEIDGIYFGQRGQNLNNIFEGVNAGRNNVSGDYNIFEGVNAGRNNVSGSNNIFEGVSAGYGNVNGSNNTIIGNVNLGNTSNNFVIATGETRRIWGVGNDIAIGTTLVAPHSTAHVQGSFATRPISINVNTTLDNTHSFVEVTASNIVITLPNANTCAGREYKIIKTSVGGLITIETNGGLINGATKHDISGEYKGHILISNGVDWLIMTSN